MRAISKALCKFVQKWLPSAYALALSLTLVAFLGALFLTDSTVMDCVKYMSQGMYSLLSFTMQMVLVLVTGHTPTPNIREDQKPLVYQGNGHLALDCGCVYGGNLAAYCIETQEVVYVPCKQENA